MQVSGMILDAWFRVDATTLDRIQQSSVVLLDLIAIRDHMDEPTEAGHFRSDVRSDGVINLFDLIDVRDHLDTVFAGPCP